MPDESFPIKIVRLRPEALLPHRASEHASGFDLYACLPAPGFIELSRDPITIPTGLAIESPMGVDAQIRPRSSLSLRGIGVALGTIDADYRGEVLVSMWVFGSLDRYRINHGDRIAQLVFSWLAPVTLAEVEKLSPSGRGEGGHGSTGPR